MPRIFASLALTNLLLFIVSGAIGIWARHWSVDRHVLMSVLALLFGCFVQVVVFTYLTVTGKMIGQAVHLGGLDSSFLQDTKKHKRVVTRCLAAVFLSILLLTATGAAAWRLGQATVWHDVAVGFLLIVHMLVFTREYEIVYLNAKLMTSVLQDYEKARQAKTP